MSLRRSHRNNTISVFLKNLSLHLRSQVQITKQRDEVQRKREDEETEEYLAVVALSSAHACGVFNITVL